MSERHCFVCNKTFEAINPKNIYCSNKCAKKNLRNKRISQGLCISCGQEVYEINPFTGNKFTECINHRIQNINREIICKECGKTFLEPTYHFRRFCSRKCKSRNNSRSYRKNNPDHMKMLQNNYYLKRRKSINQELRNNLFDLYGHQCALCGHTDHEVLTLDHVLGDGGYERRIKSKNRIIKDAIAVYNPQRFRILCMNCNWKLRFSYNTNKENNL